MSNVLHGTHYMEYITESGNPIWKDSLCQWEEASPSYIAENLRTPHISWNSSFLAFQKSGLNPSSLHYTQGL